jgi:hypothetical protein
MVVCVQKPRDATERRTGYVDLRADGNFGAPNTEVISATSVRPFRFIPVLYNRSLSGKVIGLRL